VSVFWLIIYLFVLFVVLLLMVIIEFIDSFQSPSPTIIIIIIMFRSFLLLLLTSTVTNAQLVAPMSVCFSKEATEQEVQAYCQSVPDCGELADPSSADCFMRCDNMLTQEGAEYDCESMGLKCHTGLVCVKPPKMIQEDEEEDEFGRN
jgi:type II secretory pathway component PulF